MHIHIYTHTREHTHLDTRIHTRAHLQISARAHTQPFPHLYEVTLYHITFFFSNHYHSLKFCFNALNFYCLLLIISLVADLFQILICKVTE